MTNDQRFTVFVLLLGFLGIGIFLGDVLASSWHQEQAIKANVGYYDPKTGDFKYKIMDENSSM